MLTPEHPCPECGGQLALRSEPGRFRRYRGEEGFEIPASLAIPTCDRCGRLWLDSAMVRDLGRHFEAERQRRLADREVFRPVAYIDRLFGQFAVAPRANTVSLGDLHRVAFLAAEKVDAGKMATLHYGHITSIDSRPEVGSQVVFNRPAHA